MKEALTLFIDLPISATAALAGAAVLFVFSAGIAFIIFRLIRRSVRMAIKLAIAAALVILALAAGTAVWWFSASETGRPRPTPQQRR